MSLLHPTIGEKVDRAALLSVKIDRGRALGRDVSHFMQELKEIAESDGTDGEAHGDWILELLLLHEEMFDLIARAEAGDETVSAVVLQRLNRRRVEVREKIDRAEGQFRGPERI